MIRTLLHRAVDVTCDAALDAAARARDVRDRAVAGWAARARVPGWEEIATCAPAAGELPIAALPDGLDHQLVAAIGHDSWCDYGDGCGPYGGCGVWDTVARVRTALRPHVQGAA